MSNTPRSSPLTHMRLAIDLGPLYGHQTGVGVAVAGMMSALDARADIELDPYVVSFRSQLAPGHQRLPLPGIAASHLWSRFDRPRADRWLHGADVVHGTNYVAPPSRLPTVISVYDCWFLAHPDAATPLVRRAGENLKRRVAAGAWVHTSSEATAVQARELLDTDRVVAAHLGPPRVTDAPSNPHRELPHLAGSTFVLAIGTEERRKALPTLIRAFATLAAEFPEVRLVLAGAPGDDTDDVTHAIVALPESAQQRVERLGVIDSETKAWLLRRASVLAYPSLDEGFGFPILEAQQAATPVVASDVGSVGEVAGDGASLVADPSPERFADALARVITDGGERLRLITAGAANVRRFSWDTTASGIAEIYRLALDAA